MMTDPVLGSRLDSLSQNLQRLQQSVALIEEVPLERASAEELFDNVSREIEEEIHSARLEIDEIRKLLGSGSTEDDPLVEAWERFVELETKTRSLFRGCLELIGGVAFREKGGVDQHLWRVADAFNVELCRQALKQSFNYLTVPALEEALSGSMVRTIRLRFPEWSVWSLPLVAYEFGHAAIGAREEFDRLYDKHVTRLVDSDQALRQFKADGDDPRLLRRKRLIRGAHSRRVRMLFGDAVATYMLGPCYACATIHLRLDPTGAADPGRATSQERAQVVLGCLRAMDEKSGGLQKQFIETLEEQWEQAVQRSRPHGVGDASGLTDLSETMLPDFIDALNYLPNAARLTARSWQQAVSFQLGWKGQLEHGDELQLELSRKDQLREILNAAWLTRVGEPQQAETIEAATLKACLVVLQLREMERARRPLLGEPGHDDLVSKTTI
jgi:hypothetical protein